MAGQYKVVCYYGSWAADREAPMTFGASDVPAGKCTHVIYAFAGLDDDGRIVSLNPELDINKGAYRLLNGFRQRRFLRGRNKSKSTGTLLTTESLQYGLTSMPQGITAPRST